jgi:hypothetical protein
MPVQTARFAPRRQPARAARVALLVCVGLASIGASVALAQDGDESPFDSWATAVADSLAPRWAGPRVDWPEVRPRPEVAGRLDSPLHPVSVQVGRHIDAERASTVMRALETAHGWMERRGWPTPVPDGGYGGTPGFDLYLVERPLPDPDTDLETEEAAAEAEVDGVPAEDVGIASARPIRVSYDAPLVFGGLDAVAPFAILDAGVAPSRLEPCAISAYVQASLLGVDPAEAPAWRIATGDYVAWLLTGYFGCGDGISRQQRQSGRSWISSAPDSGEGGALFLAMLSARTDGLTGDFIRDLWSGAPQLTWEGERLRAAPDMWQVVYTVMEVGQDPLPRLIEEMGVSRYFAGSERRRVGAPMELLRSLPDGAEVPVLGEASFDELPRRFEPSGLELEPQGSAYVLVDTTSAPAGSVLRVWMRGEYGVGWSLTAVRLAADGSERGRVRAPVRPRTPRSYIPLELTDDHTASVLLVVTNMGGRLVDADEPDDQVRAFELIIDRQPGVDGD